MAFNASPSGQYSINTNAGWTQNGGGNTNAPASTAGTNTQSGSMDNLTKLIQGYMQSGNANFRPVQSYATSNQVDPIYGSQGQQLRDFLAHSGNTQYNKAIGYADQYGQAAQSAYNNPFWGQALGELQNVSQPMQQANAQLSSTMAGNYLKPSSYLTNAIQQAQGTAERNAADQNAQIRSKMGRAGIGFSSADRLSEAANSGALRSNAQATAAQAYADNYAKERQNQMQATQTAGQLQQIRNAQLGMGADMMGQRTNLLQNAAAMQMQPLTSYAQLLDSYKAATRGQENVQGTSNMDYATFLAGFMKPNVSTGAF